MSFTYDNPIPPSSSGLLYPAALNAPSSAGPPGMPIVDPTPASIMGHPQHSDRMLPTTAPTPTGIGSIDELIRTPIDTTALKNWCDRVAIKWRLTSDQLGDLKQLVVQGSCLDAGHLRLWLWNQTTIYHLINKVESQAIEYESFKATMDEVQKQVVAAWAPSKAEHTTIRVITRDMLISPTRTAYMQLARDVMDHLRTNQVKLGLESAFTTPAREACLEAVVKKKASNARTALRSVLILSIAGKCMTPLEDAVFDILTKFRKGGVGSRSDTKADYQIVISLLRRWTFEDHWQGAPAMKEYKKLLDESEDDRDDNITHAGAATQPYLFEEESEDEANRQTSKKRRYNSTEAQVMQATVGRVPKGEDFFSKMDGRWKASLHVWGLNWKESDLWKNHINDTIKRDHLFFGQSMSAVLPPLPFIPSTTTASAATSTATSRIDTSYELLATTTSNTHPTPSRAPTPQIHGFLATDPRNLFSGVQPITGTNLPGAGDGSQAYLDDIWGSGRA
ncbi:hypothetical protein BC628DRAFT_1419251 [Trametes gibbosa]|nr:hypothetical protein BC628DRAFT_1419251 [Trametes gibbosa]